MPEPVERPNTVDFAFRLSVISVISVVSLVITLAYTLSMRQQLLDSMRIANERMKEFLQEPVRSQFQQNFSESFVDQALVFIIVSVIAVLQLLFAFLMRSGKNWARIVLTILSVIGIVGRRVEVNHVVLMPPWFVAVPTVVLGLAVIILMYLPASNHYFSQRGR